jgi:hypothetical protein
MILDTASLVGATCCMCRGPAMRLGGPWWCATCRQLVCSLFCIERHAIVVDHKVRVELAVEPRR